MQKLKSTYPLVYTFPDDGSLSPQAVIERNTPVDAELTVDGVPAIQQIIVPA